MSGDDQHFECPDGSRWIRFEKYNRYHAIYTIDSGLYWTYCGRNVRMDSVSTAVEVPPARCACCRSRLLRPYLIPARMMRLKENRL